VVPSAEVHTDNRSSDSLSKDRCRVLFPVSIDERHRGKPSHTLVAVDSISLVHQSFARRSTISHH
jgi:hypothetical protein